MQSTRIWNLAAVVVIALVLAGSWFLGVSPQLDAASTARADRSDVEAQNRIQEAKVVALEEQSHQLNKFNDELDSLHRSVPAQANLSEFVGQVSTLAARWGVNVSQFTAGDPSVFVKPIFGPEDPDVAAAQSAIVSGTLLTIPVGIVLGGEYNSVIGFVNELQQGERLVLVHGLSLAGGGRARCSSGVLSQRSNFCAA